ncbi:hypothetical protein BC834DRAFT_632042 [Gloeopeniophorella convolvens]|nr:hypothetical protein BC834DRAFT_632042 [Gloeopeniophorella convolvens]
MRIPMVPMPQLTDYLGVPYKHRYTQWPVATGRTWLRIPVLSIPVLSCLTQSARYGLAYIYRCTAGTRQSPASNGPCLFHVTASSVFASCTPPQPCFGLHCSGYKAREGGMEGSFNSVLLPNLPLLGLPDLLQRSSHLQAVPHQPNPLISAPPNSAQVAAMVPYSDYSSQIVPHGVTMHDDSPQPMSLQVTGTAAPRPDYPYSFQSTSHTSTAVPLYHPIRPSPHPLSDATSVVPYNPFPPFPHPATHVAAALPYNSHFPQARLTSLPEYYSFRPPTVHPQLGKEPLERAPELHPVLEGRHLELDSAMPPKPVRVASSSRPGKRRRMDGFPPTLCYSAPHTDVSSLKDDVLLEIIEWYITHRSLWYSGVLGLREFIHTCRRWRYLTLRSSKRLGLRLCCTFGVPVTDLLTHFPSLPISLHYLATSQRRTLRPEDKEGIIRAMEQSHRLEEVVIEAPAHHVQGFLAAMDGCFPSLQRLSIETRESRDNWLPKSTNKSRAFILPPTFAAPRLTSLHLNTSTLLAEPKEFPHLSAIQALALRNMSSATLTPEHLVNLLSATAPLLEYLDISFGFPGLPYRDVGTTPSQAPAKNILGLPHLSSFEFRGAHEYFDDLVSRISMPLLDLCVFVFFNRLPLAPGNSGLLSYRFWKPFVADYKSVIINFGQRSVGVASWEEHAPTTENMERELVSWTLDIESRQFDWQVTSAAEFTQSLAPELLEVDSLRLYFGFEREPPEWLDASEPEDWCNILRPFSNVKMLVVSWELRHDVSRSLMSSGVEASLDLLPELQTLVLVKPDDPDVEPSPSRLLELPTLEPEGDDDGSLGENLFADFIEARKGVNRPVSFTYERWWR